jgi:hypothetical protein
MTVLRKIIVPSLLLFAVCVWIPSGANAQLNSSGINVTLNASLLELVTISATPTTVNFTLVGSGTSTGNSAISITTTWVLAIGRSNLKLYGYFSSSTAALSDGSGHNIPSSSVSGSVNSGSYAAFTSTTPFATASGLQIFTQSVSGITLDSNRTDSLALEINTTGLNLPAASYTGTLVLEAQAT